MLRVLMLLLLAIVLCSCDNVFFDEEPPNNPEGNFLELWTSFNERYAVFEQRNVNWKRLFDIYRPQVSSTTSDDELHRIITDMLSHLDDAHVSLFAEGKDAWSGHQEFREPTGLGNFDLGMIIDRYLSGDVTNIANRIFYGDIGGDIGYIGIFDFQGGRPLIIDDILREMQDLDGIIIDLRRNAGGDFTNGLFIAGRFADQKRLAFTAIPKNGPGENDFAQPLDYFVEPAGGLQYLKPTVLLTDRYTLSAGESTVLFFREFPHVTVVGESTTGAMGERIEKELPNGWVYSITAQLIIAADGISYEGPGIPPDIFVTNSEMEINDGWDSVLEKAIEIINMSQ